MKIGRKKKSWSTFGVLFKSFFGQKRTEKPDMVFFGLALVLLVIGFLILTSASSVVGLERHADSYFFLKRQLIQGLPLGIMLGIFLYRVPLLVLQKNSFALFVFSLLLLVLVFIPQLGDERLGASRWIMLGEFSFQPSEVVKLTFVIYLASWLTKQKEKIKDFQATLIPFVVLLLVICGLIILQPDLGTMGIFIALAMSMYFVAGGQLLQLGLLTVAGAAAVYGLIKAAPYRAARFVTFLNPDLDPSGTGYHIKQSLLAIGSGGWFGQGLGHSRQKFQYLPEVYGDSIFAVLAEELGFVFTGLIVVLFIYFFIRGLQIAKRVPDSFAKLIVIGIIAWWGTQTLVNIGAMVNLLPLTGVPLPFVSFGSTALAVNLASLGLILNISQQAKSD